VRPGQTPQQPGAPGGQVQPPAGPPAPGRESVPTAPADTRLNVPQVATDFRSDEAAPFPALERVGVDMSEQRALSVREVIELARELERIGVDGLLSVTPYYNKPTQEGLYQHFKAINDAIGIPIIIYNIPARSVIDMSVETMARLFELKNVAGVKDATANVIRVSQQRAAIGEGFNQLSGEDASALGFMAHGGHGCISVTANVAPRLCAEFQAACLRGDYRTALDLQDKLMPLHHALFIETNPSPAKYALSLLGRCADTVRLPMVTLADKTKAAVRAAMVHAGLLN